MGATNSQATRMLTNPNISELVKTCQNLTIVNTLTAVSGNFGNAKKAEYSAHKKEVNKYMIEGLTLLQNRFVKYMTDPNTKNQTQAARLAGYSASRAHLTASELMRKPKIRQAIEELERSQKVAESIAER